MESVDVTFIKLQSLTALASHQKESLDQLGRGLKRMCYAVRPIFDTTTSEHEVSVGAYSMSIANAIRFIKDQGTFTADKFIVLDETTQADVARNVSRFMLKLINGIENVCGERNQLNQAIDSPLPPVLPYQWVKVATSDLVDILRIQQQRIGATQSRDAIRRIEEDHKGLKRAFSNEQPLREILEKHNTQTTFKEAWAAVNGRFKDLMHFSGGLATVFPGTAAVESDFSVLKFEKNAYRTALLDITLEGIMHCKQYKALLQA